MVVASLMIRENAWKTAISSVHGERRSSSSTASPLHPTFSLIFQHKATIAFCLYLRVDTADLKAWQRAIQGVRQMAAGSEVVRWTL
jgi:hypothetical protein